MDIQGARALTQWRKMRFVWILAGGVSVSLVAFSHYVLQLYGYMQPCEQCVYIRYAFVVLALGAWMVAINPRRAWLCYLGYACMLYASMRGLMFAWRLEGIHRAVRSEELLFGVGGCSIQAEFDFGLALDRWLPAWFMPLGDCGMDQPVIPSGVVLSGLRRAFVESYADGWYLIPALQFGTMAQCCLAIFSAYLLLVGGCIWSGLLDKMAKKPS